MAYTYITILYFAIVTLSSFDSVEATSVIRDHALFKDEKEADGNKDTNVLYVKHNGAMESTDRWGQYVEECNEDVCIKCVTGLALPFYSNTHSASPDFGSRTKGDGKGNRIPIHPFMFCGPSPKTGKCWCADEGNLRWKCESGVGIANLFSLGASGKNAPKSLTEEHCKDGRFGTVANGSSSATPAGDEKKTEARCAAGCKSRVCSPPVTPTCADNCAHDCAPTAHQ